MFSKVKKMNRKEILQKVLNHESGPVPVDFGGTSVTGMHVSCVAALREYYGLEQRPVKVHEPYQMLGLIENDLLDVLGIDVIGINPRNTLFGFPNENWKPFRTPWGQEVLVSKQFNVTEKDGNLFIYPEGDTSVPPSGQMPATGYFFDTIVRQEAMNEDSLNPEDNLEEFELITDEDLKYFKTEIENAATTRRGIIANFGGTAFGDIALVPAPFLKHPKGIRDITEWYMSTITRKDYIHAIFSKQLEIVLTNLEEIKNVVGKTIDAVFLCGTDFGTQRGPLCSVGTFDELWFPYYKEMNNWIHENTNWKTFKHSCGAVGDFMPRFIQAGFDIINPVQCSAAGMDPKSLKDKYGDQIVFWGGGVDTQHILPFGTPEDVRKQVLERCEIFSKNGGFVFNAVHNIQAGTPVENIVSMIDAVREFNV